MTREEAEDQVWREWGEISASPTGLGCPVRVGPSLTEGYVWGWVVTLVPVRREECRRPCIFDKYAVAPGKGMSYPVGTKGLEHTLRCLGVISDHDFRGLLPDERQALWDRQMRRLT